MNKNIVKYILCGIFLSIYPFSNLHAEDPYFHSKTFSHFTTLMFEHNYVVAKQEIDKILLNFPNDINMQMYGHFYLGYVEGYLQNYTSAITAYQYVIDHESELKNAAEIQHLLPGTIYMTGISYSRLEQYGNATIQFMKVIDNYSDSDRCDMTIRNGLKACYRDLNIENDTENMLLGIIQKYSKHKVKFYALKHLARFYIKKADYDKALATCQQILNELSLEKYPDLKDMKEKEIPALIQDINTQKSKKK